MLLILLSSFLRAEQSSERSDYELTEKVFEKVVEQDNFEFGYSADLTKETLIQQLRKEYKDVQFFEADFVQKSKQSGLEAEQSGHIYTAKPKSIRWEFKTPTEQLFISDGASQWIYTPMTNQAIQSTDMSSHPAIGLLNDLSQIEDHFTVEIAAQNAESIDVSIKPHNADLSQQFESMQVKLSKEPLQIREFYLKDTMGGEFILSFSNIQFDRGAQELSEEAQKARASLFLFVPPEGTDVIKADTFNQ